MDEEKTRAEAGSHAKKVIGVVTGVALVTAGVFLLPSILAWGFVHPPRRYLRKNPRTAHGVVFERVRLRSADGTRLAAWYVPPTDEVPVRGVVILCHGYWGSRSSMLPHMGFLHKAGYACVLFDFRAHGWSGGMRTTFGVAEAGDLAAAIDWVKIRSEVAELPLAVVSESMGAAVTLMVAAEDARIDAVVADSAFSRFDGAIETRLGSIFGEQFAKAVAPPVQKIGERMIKYACYDIAPIEAIGKISPRPVFLIQGTADEVVPPRCLGELFAASDPEHTEKWSVEGSKHVKSVHDLPAIYERRVLDFLERSLPQPVLTEDT